MSTNFNKLTSLTKKAYKDQAIWFLNGFWHKYSNDAELVWKYVHKFQQIDLQKGAEGNEVDEMNAHKFLESFQQTQTVREMRDNLRATGAIQGNPKAFPLTHFFIFKYQVNWKDLINSTQGDNKEEIEEAQRKLKAVQIAFNASQKKAEEAKAALDLSKTREREAKAKEQESIQKEAELKAAKIELEAALAELKAQESAFNNKTNSLKAKSEDESTSVVQRNKSKNELAQHLAEDPLPLRRSKINQEAAVKKAEKATKAAADAVVASEAATRAAADAVAASEKAKQAAEKAVEDMSAKVDEAEAFLQEVKSKPGVAAGAIWWMERELHEAKAYLPEKKGGYRKN